jgi:hypothetical protein
MVEVLRVKAGVSAFSVVGRMADPGNPIRRFNFRLMDSGDANERAALDRCYGIYLEAARHPDTWAVETNCGGWNPQAHKKCTMRGSACSLYRKSWK